MAKMSRDEFMDFFAEGGRRRYDPSDVAKVMQRDVTEKPRVTIAYARVSTHDQKKDLETQVERVKIECVSRSWPDVEVVTSSAAVASS
jgi:predicted site-specific integrase-resolvase